MKSRGAAGFSLIELMIAASLTSLVVLGVMAVAAAMVRSHIETTMRGGVSEWTLLSLQGMHKEIENATYIVSPALDAGDDTLVICQNYSRIAGGTGLPWDSGGGRVNVHDGGPSGPPVQAFKFCVADAGSPAKPTLFRHGWTPANCNPPPPVPGEPACGAASVLPNTTTVIARRVYRTVTTPPYPGIFIRRSDGVELHFTVGESTPATKSAGSQAAADARGAADVLVTPNLKIDTKIRTNKHYGNLVD